MPITLILPLFSYSKQKRASVRYNALTFPKSSFVQHQKEEKFKSVQSLQTCLSIAASAKTSDILAVQ